MTQQERSIAPEIREKIAMLYYGQSVLQKGSYDCVTMDIPKRITMHNHHLLLKPLSSITYEDALEVAEIIYRSKFGDSQKRVVVEDGMVSVFHDGERTTIYPDFYVREISGDPTIPMSGEAIDFLRSRSYATPCFGFTVEELEQAGIFKIKEA